MGNNYKPLYHSDINETFIIESIDLSGSTIFTACTGFYTNALVSCSGDTQILMGNGVISFDGNLYTNDSLTASTINASTFYSGGTNLFNIIDSKSITGGTFNNILDTLSLYKTNGDVINVTGFTDYYTTGATLIGNTVYFDRTDALSAYTLDLSVYTANTYTTGITYNDNVLVITRNDGFSMNTYINSFTGLTISGLLSVQNISANTISATTFYGDGKNITGLPYVTGGTFNNFTDSIDFTNSTGGTFSVTGLTDYYITGGTFSTNSKTLRYTRNDNVNIDVNLPFRLLINSSASTSGNSFTTIDTITGITNNTNVFVVSYITAFKDNIDYGFWKRTIALNKNLNVVTLIGENVDFDRASSGLTPTSVVFVPNSGNLDIKISGETSKNYTWTSNWEIIK